MRRIAFMNQKGGVGKTTTSVNISAALALKGKRVLLIDLDPQAHATLHFGLEPQVEFPSLYDVLVEDKELKDVRQQIDENLWLIPAHLDLAGVELQLASIPGREMILRDKLASDDMEFDYIIMDCPPSLGVLTLNALSSAQEVFIPLQPHFLALHGLSKLLQTIELVAKRLNKGLRVSGVIFCMYEGTTLAKEVAEDVLAFFAQGKETSNSWSGATVFNTKIRRNVRLAEAPSFGHSIFKYAPSSNGAEDYELLTAEILEQE
ncbi:MAG: AAA family ATPase [Planctomycetia bacterium]|nr:AAA family ATPase [Planctomycetia bacterium]